MRHGFLRDFSEADLLAELERRKLPELAQTPSFVCPRCGAQEFYFGDWKPHLFERHMAALEVKHADCPLCVNGGGI